MARIELADRNKLPEEFKERFNIIERSNGYIPNSYLLLAHRPPILKALMDLSQAVIRDEGTLDRGFRFLIAYMSSRTAGCQFCQAHNISSASRWGVSDEKLNAIWDYETSPLFNDGERAAFDLARAASVVPNAVDDEIFQRLKKHFTSEQIIEMVSVIALFGWQNRLNDTLQTDLDAHTLDWAAQFGLAEKTGWNPEDHLGQSAETSLTPPNQLEASMSATTDGPRAFNLMKWIAENPDKLRPPLGAKTIFREDDFMVTVVGGPNARTDYHVNPTEEFFFQIKGDVKIGIQHDGKPYDLMLPEGSIYLLPANVPHAPQRGPNTIGLIVERIRKNGLLDTHRWYCEDCNNVLFEKTVQIEILERDMPPIFDAYYGNPDHQLCKACGHRNPGRP